MKLHRNSMDWQCAFGVYACVCRLCLLAPFVALFLAQASLATFGEQSSNTSRFEGQIDFYLRYAFRDKEQLQKFEFVPDVVFSCVDRSYCERASEILREALPPKSTIAVLSSVQPDKSIELTIEAETLEAIKAATETSGNNGAATSFGDQRCSIFQVRSSSRIDKLAVFAAKTEGLSKNEVCFIWGLMHGSGLSVDFDYDDLQKILHQPGGRDLSMLRTASSGLLHYHWSTLLKPGQSRDQAETTLRQFLDSDRNK